jgi:tRNA(fMet)-specific endonuclease VapC
MHFVNDAHRFRKIDKMIEKVGVANLFVSSITVYEIQTKLVKAKVGKVKLNALAETLAIFKVINFNTGAAIAAAKVRAELENVGDGIGHPDQMIAGHAKYEKAILVTNNTRHFRLVHGLKIVDWTE